MCCIRGICILAPGANVSANLTFHPVDSSSLKSHVESMQFSGQHLGLRAVARTLIGGGVYIHYSGYARLTSIEINFISKETSRAEPEL